MIDYSESNKIIEDISSTPLVQPDLPNYDYLKNYASPLEALMNSSSYHDMVSRSGFCYRYYEPDFESAPTPKVPYWRKKERKVNPDERTEKGLRRGWEICSRYFAQGRGSMSTDRMRKGQVYRADGFYGQAPVKRGELRGRDPKLFYEVDYDVPYYTIQRSAGADDKYLDEYIRWCIVNDQDLDIIVKNNWEREKWEERVSRISAEMHSGECNRQSDDCREMSLSQHDPSTTPSTIQVPPGTTQSANDRATSRANNSNSPRAKYCLIPFNIQKEFFNIPVEKESSRLAAIDENGEVALIEKKRVWSYTVHPFGCTSKVPQADLRIRTVNPKDSHQGTGTNDRLLYSPPSNAYPDGCPFVVTHKGIQKDPEGVWRDKYVRKRIDDLCSFSENAPPPWNYRIKRLNCHYVNTYKLNTPLTKGIWFDHWHAVEYDNDVEAAIAIVLALKEKTKGVSQARFETLAPVQVMPKIASAPDPTDKLKKLINKCLDMIAEQEN